MFVDQVSYLFSKLLLLYLVKDFYTSSTTAYLLPIAHLHLFIERSIADCGQSTSKRNLLDLVSMAINAKGLSTYSSSSYALHDMSAMVRIRRVRESMAINSVERPRGMSKSLSNQQRLSSSEAYHGAHSADRPG